MTLARRVADAVAMERLGAALAQCARGPARIWLQGALGAGKTTLVRGFLHARGHTGKVKSPTYTLVEPYGLASGTVYHFDLYRLQDPYELELIGARDYFDAGAVCLVEWPERAAGALGRADLEVLIDIDGRRRRVTLRAPGALGEAILACLRARRPGRSARCATRSVEPDGIENA